MNVFLAGNMTESSNDPGARHKQDEVYLVTSFNKNISVFLLFEKQYLYNLSIDNKEMACSRQHKNKFFVGTFCDTLFLFIYDAASKKLVPSSEMRTHESIISLALLSDDLVICGQSNGYIDTISCRPSKKKAGEYRLDNVASKFYNNLGYVNCIQVCSSSSVPGSWELALACELGLYFGTVTGIEFELQKDIYC
jgi:hypothetical protein